MSQGTRATFGHRVEDGAVTDGHTGSRGIAGASLVHRNTGDGHGSGWSDSLAECFDTYDVTLCLNTGWDRWACQSPRLGIGNRSQSWSGRPRPPSHRRWQ